MRHITCFVVLLVLAAPVCAAEAFTAERPVMIDRIGAPAVSPDGSTVVYAVRHPDLDADRGRYDLWMNPVAGGDAQRLKTYRANVQTHFNQ